MPKPKAILTSKGERWFQSGHPWIFKDDILTFDEAGNGDIVALYNRQTQFLGWAFYSRYSRIAFRLIASHPRTIDHSYWFDHLQKTIERKKPFMNQYQACRLVFSEADRFPGLIADWYAGHLVIQTLIPGTDRLLTQLVSAFQELIHPKSILIRNDLEVRSLEHLPQEIQIFSGPIPEKVWIQEGSIHYGVDLVKGQKTGAYLDQRENRIDLVSKNPGPGRVLDCFCYTGGFALHLAKKAQEVWAVDDSAPAIEGVKTNADRNGLSNIRAIKNNVFDFLKEIEEQGHGFDLIILDPPPFAKKKPAVSTALRGYLELNRRALKCLNPGGILSTYSCSYHISDALFLDLLAQAGRKAGKRVVLLEKRAQALDHPIVLSFPESHYLKGLDVQVIE